MPSEAIKLEREKRKTAREARLWELANDPMIKRLILLCAIMGYSAYAYRKGGAHPIEKAIAMSLPTAGLPLLAADAGITDKWALAAFSALGATYALGEAGLEFADSLPREERALFGGLVGAGPRLLL